MTFSVSPLEGTEEFRSLNSLVNQSDVSVPDTIQSIINLSLSTTSSTAGHSDALELHCERLFESVIDVASRTPIPQQVKLVDFLIQLQKLNVIDPVTGKPLECDGRKIWADLPRIGMSFREAWNFDPQDTNATPEDKAGWENKTAFLAQVTALSPIGNPSEITTSLNCSLYALWAMRSAFEGTTPADTTLRAACLWIIYAGDRLLMNVENELTFEANLGIPGGSYKKKEWRGFNKERMEVWKNGFKAAQTRHEGETRSMIDRALAKIDG
ncbi:uncharacterized protein GGS22DRAFT_184351 [Annulohypoxylon maeteangense]|uniref:uncharacterized protein n=1 Tax=Annulohypoxylon maeteangense TaxID=1927788 RepID=UPI0020081EEF|nr:uncharacterized protein GGS22DRAFT_184351 [Annulohypoxylon maeteangense]KAI0888772.1 hypothetical protein GGS22DRAFT_184351 [Annulohypoxylon maeteangense]